MANKQLQLRRGTAAETDAVTLAEGEVTYVTDTKTLRAFDGSTQGGTELLKADMSNVSATGSTITIDAKIVLSDDDYATLDGDDDLTLATKGWVSNQGSGGGLVGAQSNIGDTSITSATLGDFLVYQGGSAPASAKWVNQKISGDVNVDNTGASVIQADAVETAMILDANVTNAKLENPNVVVTDGTTAHTLSLGNTLTFSGTSNETTVVQNAGTVTIGLVDAPQLGNVTAGTLSVTNDLTVGGNLTVSGSVTTVNTETINLADNLITLNSNLANNATPTENGGIEINRGTLANVALRWNESDSGVGSHKWQVTEDGASYYDIVHVGDTGTVIGDMIAGDAIDGTKIADNAIDSEHYVDGSIDNDHIADDTITSAKLADFTDTLAKSNGYIVAANGSTLTSLAPAGDIGATVSGSTITFGITSGAIVNADVSATAAIDGSKLAAKSVAAAQIADATITVSQIADNAIQAAKILGQAVTKDKLHTNVAGAGLTGGNGSALAIDLSSVTDEVISVANDSIAFLDVTTSGTLTTYATRKESVADLVSAFSGDHMTATEGVLSIDNFAGVTAGSITGSKAVIVDGSGNVSGFGTIGATTFSGTLSGQVSTATQSSITSIPSLGTVGALGTGSITSGFGSIDVGTSTIAGGTITATAFSGPITGAVTGNVSGNLTGQVSTATQESITSIPNLVTVGTLSGGAISDDFGPIDVGTSAISGGTITATAFYGTLNTVSQPNITSVGTLSSLGVDQLSLDTHIISSSTIMQISAGTGKAVAIEGVSINDNDVTGIGTLTTTGDITVGGTAAVNGGEITSTATTLNLSANTAVQVESVVFTDSEVTGISNLTATGTITANTFDGSFSGTVSSDVLTSSTLTVTSQLSLDTAALVIDGTEVTSDASELNFLDGSIKGTAVANKAVVLDANKRVTGLEKVTINNTNAGEDGLTLTNGNVTLGSGNLVLTQGDLTINSRFEVGPNSVVTSTSNEMRFEDSLLELNYDSNASLSDAANLERHGGIWMQTDKDNASTSTTGLLVDTNSDWYLVKGSARPNANYLSGLSSKTRAGLHVGSLSSSGAVTLATATITTDTELDDTHHIVFCNGVTNLTLPGAVAGREYIIRNIHGTDSVSILTSTVDSTKQGLDGVTDDSSGLDAGAKLHIVSDGSNWYSI